MQHDIRSKHGEEIIDSHAIRKIESYRAYACKIWVITSAYRQNFRARSCQPNGKWSANESVATRNQHPFVPIVHLLTQNLPFQLGQTPAQLTSTPVQRTCFRLPCH